MVERREGHPYNKGAQVKLTEIAALGTPTITPTRQVGFFVSVCGNFFKKMRLCCVRLLLLLRAWAELTLCSFLGRGTSGSPTFLHGWSSTSFALLPFGVLSGWSFSVLLSRKNCTSSTPRLHCCCFVLLDGGTPGTEQSARRGRQLHPEEGLLDRARHRAQAQAPGGLVASQQHAGSRYSVVCVLMSDVVWRRKKLTTPSRRLAVVCLKPTVLAARAPFSSAAVSASGERAWAGAGAAGAECV